MQNLEFDAFFGDEIKHVEVTQPFGAGGETWHIMIDKYYKGSLFCRNGEYSYFDKWLNKDDIQSIVDRVKEANEI